MEIRQHVASDSESVIEGSDLSESPTAQLDTDSVTDSEYGSESPTRELHARNPTDAVARSPDDWYGLTNNWLFHGIHGVVEVLLEDTRDVALLFFRMCMSQEAYERLFDQVCTIFFS